MKKLFLSIILTFKLFLFANFLNLLFISDAQAYIDPGTITIIFQGILSAIVAGGVAIKIYWHKLKTFFKKEKKDKSD